MSKRKMVSGTSPPIVVPENFFGDNGRLKILESFWLKFPEIPLPEVGWPRSISIGRFILPRPMNDRQILEIIGRRGVFGGALFFAALTGLLQGRFSKKALIADRRRANIFFVNGSADEVLAVDVNNVNLQSGAARWGISAYPLDDHPWLAGHQVFFLLLRPTGPRKSCFSGLGVVVRVLSLA